MKRKGDSGETTKSTKARKSGSGKQAQEADNKAETVPIDDDLHNQGFGEWLRSRDGVEMMRLFVIANSILVFVTMAWPNMQGTFAIVKQFFLGDNDQ
ncbi:uncharacterized protein Xport-A [Prorops nasuta]|uniref:uncharacterized protein Xport-A n=1 Tax=Prorops nasuta TaxID=863751 RepID=UPI0034CD3954